MKLTTEQEDIVRAFVKAKGIKRQTLQDDIIDHLCCVLESEPERGMSFEQRLHKVAEELAPDGLMTIERQTVFLLNAKRIILMKKLMYLTGFLGAVALTAGVTFKLLRMPWGNELFMAGFLTLLLIFIPLVTFDRFKVAISKALSEKLKIILGGTAAVITGLAGLFKLLHLQGAEVLLMLGAFIFAAGFLPFLFFTMYKKSVS